LQPQTPFSISKLIPVSSNVGPASALNSGQDALFSPENKPFFNQLEAILQGEAGLTNPLVDMGLPIEGGEQSGSILPFAESLLSSLGPTELESALDPLALPLGRTDTLDTELVIEDQSLPYVHPLQRLDEQRALVQNSGQMATVASVVSGSTSGGAAATSSPAINIPVDQALLEQKIEAEVAQDSLLDDAIVSENLRERHAKNDQFLAIGGDKAQRLDAMLKASSEPLVPASPTAHNPSAGEGLAAAARETSNAATLAQTATPKLSTFLNTPVTDPRWKNDFSDRVSWAAKQGIQEAEIKMTPAHLGRVEIRISVNEDQQASMTIFAKHGSVRDAIDASLPRLREMLSTQGLELGDVTVSEHSLNDQRQQFAGGDREAAGADSLQVETGVDSGAVSHPVDSSGEMSIDPFLDQTNARVDFYA